MTLSEKLHVSVFRRNLRNFSEAVFTAHSVRFLKSFVKFIQNFRILAMKRMIDPEFAGELHSELTRLISSRSPKSPSSGTRGRKRKGLRKSSEISNKRSKTGKEKLRVFQFIFFPFRLERER